MPEPLAPALAEIRRMLGDPDGLVRAVASGRRRRGDPPAWRRVEVRPVVMRDERHVQLVRYDARQAHTDNLAYGPDADAALDDLVGIPFGSWRVETTETTVQLRVTKKGEAQVHREPAATPRAQRLAHDRAKPRLLADDDVLFRVLGASRDKRRQVEDLLRLLDPVLDEAPASPGEPLRVVDLGCGNAYLTFAAYRFLTGTRGRTVDLVGVDTREDARTRNTALARDLAAGGVQFCAGTILDAPVPTADVVLALHACDTATDEALARAVRWAAPVVLAAPCCHHDVAAQIRQGSPPHPYGLVMRHGILRERYADVLTDALRAALLRMLGYRVDVVEFVPSRHTPRNVLLRAVRTGAVASPETVAEYCALTAAWGVRPALERLVEDLLPPEVTGGPRPRA
ncbi:MAG: class I SAM-dependent methyltransferase [Actinomycetes bacterium]